MKNTPEEDWVFAIGNALLGRRVGKLDDRGNVVEGFSKPALEVIVMTAQKVPDHLMRTLGDLIFTEEGANLLPEPLRPIDVDLILWTIRLGALFGLAGRSESTRVRRLPMGDRLCLGDVQQVANLLVRELEKIHVDMPNAFAAAFEGQGSVSFTYEQIMGRFIASRTNPSRWHRESNMRASAAKVKSELGTSGQIDDYRTS